MAVNSIIAGLGISATTVGSDVTVSVNPADSLAWTNKQKVLGTTSEAIPPTPPTAPWSGDPTNYSLKVSRTAPIGVSGLYQAALVVDCIAPAGIGSFEWTQLNNLDNYSTTTDNKDCVAMYCKGNKYKSGATWAGVFEARSIEIPAATDDALYGLEVDICSDGNDGIPPVIRTLPIGANMAQEVCYGEAGSHGGVQA